MHFYVIFIIIVIIIIVVVVVVSFTIVLNCQMHESIFFLPFRFDSPCKILPICGNCIQSVNQLNRQKFIIMNSTRWMQMVALQRTLFGCVYRRRFQIIAAHYFCVMYNEYKKKELENLCPIPQKNAQIPFLRLSLLTKFGNFNSLLCCSD